MTNDPDITPEEEQFWKSTIKPVDLPGDWALRTGGDAITKQPVSAPIQKKDAINPSHYKRNPSIPIECIDALRACLTPEEFRGYCKGNAMAYLWRDGQKDDPQQEAGKAGWYVEWLTGKDPRK